MKVFVTLVLGMLFGEAILALLHLAGHIEPARSINSAAVTVAVDVALIVWGAVLLSKEAA
jgi:hypothetical protein